MRRTFLIQQAASKRSWAVCQPTLQLTEHRIGAGDGKLTEVQQRR